MSISIRKKKTSKGYSLYLDIYHNGKRRYEFLELTLNKDKVHNRDVMNLAESIKAKRQLELAGETHGITVSNKGRADVVKWCENWCNNYTLANYKMFIASVNHLREFKQITTFASVTEKTATAFREYLGKRLGGQTPHDYFKCFKRMMREAVKDGQMARLVTEEIKNPNPIAGTLRKDALEPHEIAAMVQARCGNDEVRRAFLLACNTGLRGSDIRSLDWSQVNLKEKYLQLDQRKTSVRARIPLNDMAMSILSSGGKGKVFSLPTGTGVSKVLKVWKTRAGIQKHITFHCARHSFVSNILRATGNLKLAGVLAGHASTKETEKYTHLIDSEKRDAVGKL